MSKKTTQAHSFLIALIVVVVLLASACAPVTPGPVESTTDEPQATPTMPVPCTDVFVHRPALDWQTISTAVEATKPHAVAEDDVTPALPSQGITTSLTVCLYLPAVLAPMPTPVYTYTIVHTYPHDPGAFTQGLIYENDMLYEGTGLWGRSSLRKVELETGNVLQILALSNQFFGEGITIFDDRIIQLTWQSRTGFVYDDDFELLQTFKYPTEGWGITHDGTSLIMSDGTSTLYFWDPETFTETNRIAVYDDDGPVVRLNELEYIHGEIYANVWQTDLIARIDPQTGQVVGWIDLEGLLTLEGTNQTVDVLNGIAYDTAGDRLFVTGKLWPKLFEIELVCQ
jgi:glutamine cyclotransferase